MFVTSLTLENSGYKTVKTNSADEALKLLKTDLAVDLIITDYNMPVKNGLQFVKEVKLIAWRSKIPVFILSNEKSEEVKRNALKSGVTAWINKPFKFELLVQLIQRTVGN